MGGGAVVGNDAGVRFDTKPHALNEKCGLGIHTGYAVRCTINPLLLSTKAVTRLCVPILNK